MVIQESGEWTPGRKFLETSHQSRDIRGSCISLVRTLLAIQQTPATNDAILQKLANNRSQLFELGVVPNMHDTADWEDIAKNPVKVAQFAAGALLPLTEGEIIPQEDAAKIIREVGQIKPDGTYTLPRWSQMPDKLKHYIGQTATLTHVSEMLNITPGETAPFA